MKKLFVVLVMVSALVGCTNEGRARLVLENEGYTDIEFTGYNYMTCSEYRLRTGFRATNPAGRRVEGTVCCHMLHDCSLHWD